MSAKRPAALFDFDGTLTHRDTMLPFIWYVLRRYPSGLLDGPRLLWESAAYILKRIDKATAKSELLRPVGRVPAEKREALWSSFHDQKLVRLYLDQGMEKLRWHRQQGHYLVLASASVDIYMNQVARYLQFDELVCTRVVLDPTPKLVGANCYAEEKVQRFRKLAFFEQTDWAQSYAYSDHPSDLPMMQLCGHPVATNPKPKLRKLATKLGWEIVDWK